jgi:hypothetical protein
MNELEQRWTEVRELLLPLESIFDSSSTGSRSREFFRETLDANELEVALHAVCDFLLESPSVRVNETDLNRIRSAHQVMVIEDDCIEKLSGRCVTNLN